MIGVNSLQSHLMYAGVWAASSAVVGGRNQGYSGVMGAGSGQDPCCSQHNTRRVHSRVYRVITRWVVGWTGWVCACVCVCVCARVCARVRRVLRCSHDWYGSEVRRWLGQFSSPSSSSPAPVLHPSSAGLHLAVPGPPTPIASPSILYILHTSLSLFLSTFYPKPILSHPSITELCTRAQICLPLYTLSYLYLYS